MSHSSNPRGKQQPPLLLPSQRAKQASNTQRQPAAAKDDVRQKSLDSSAADAATLFLKTDSAADPYGLPLGRGVRLIAFHPCGLYVLDKPEGILSHPNKKAEISRSLLNAPYALKQECFYDLRKQSSNSDAAPSPCKTEKHSEASARKDDAALERTKACPERLYLLHRLDSATSGLLLLADNEALADSVRSAFAADTVGKTYLALCAAQAPLRTGEKGRWSDRLERKHSGAGGGVVHVHASGSGLSAVTDYTCLKLAARNSAIALLELRPLSGRTHQLRVHCAQHGLPIVGDAKYGDFRLNRALAKESGDKRLFLHATALDLDCVHQGKALRLRFVSPPPAEFEALLRDAPEGIRPAIHSVPSTTQSSRNTRSTPGQSSRNARSATGQSTRDTRPAAGRARAGKQQRPRKRT